MNEFFLPLCVRDSIDKCFSAMLSQATNFMMSWNPKILVIFTAIFHIYMLCPIKTNCLVFESSRKSSKNMNKIAFSIINKIWNPWRIIVTTPT